MMHTVAMLEQAIRLAESLGYGVRHEWLGGGTGGVCEIAGRQWLFVDSSLNPMERLDQVTEALRQDARIHTVEVPEALRGQLDVRHAA